MKGKKGAQHAHPSDHCQSSAACLRFCSRRFRWVLFKEVPCVAGFIYNFVVPVEDGDREFVAAQIFPDVFYRIEFRSAKPLSTGPSASIRRAVLFFSPGPRRCHARSRQIKSGNRYCRSGRCRSPQKPASRWSFTDLRIPNELQFRAVGISRPRD
jgi:hypothetical protein